MAKIHDHAMKGEREGGGGGDRDNMEKKKKGRQEWKKKGAWRREVEGDNLAKKELKNEEIRL